jgi:hypothetical protein
MYNGSSALVTKIEALLGEKKISTMAAVRLILEKQLNDIKENHLRDERLELIIKRQDEIERRSLGMWIYKHPKRAFAIVFVFYSFAISDIRQPVFAWLGGIVKVIISAL